MTHPLPSADELRSALTAFLAAHLPPSAEPVVADLRRLGGGSSQENWAFDACWADAGRRVDRALLLRRTPSASVVASRRAFSSSRSAVRTSDASVPGIVEP